MRYDYCPRCGKKLVGRRAGDDGNVPYCETCGKYWFDTFSDCSIILVANENNELAMIQQNYLSDIYWTYVAGFITPGENAEEAARREVLEELGLHLDRLEYGGTYWYVHGEQLMHGFIGTTKKQDFTMSREVARAEWVPVDEAPDRMFPPAPGNTLQPLYQQYVRMIGRDELVDRVVCG